MADCRIQLRIARGRGIASSTPHASCGVALIQNVLDGSASLPDDVPRARNLSITIRVDYLATPADSSLLGLDLVLGLAIDLIVDLRIHPANDRTAELVEIYSLVGIVIELKVMG